MYKNSPAFFADSNLQDAAKFEATLPTVPHTPSSGQRSRIPSNQDNQSPLRVDGEGTFISRSDSALRREGTEGSPPGLESAEPSGLDE